MIVFFFIYLYVTKPKNIRKKILGPSRFHVIIMCVIFTKIYKNETWKCDGPRSWHKTHWHLFTVTPF